MKESFVTAALVLTSTTFVSLAAGRAERTKLIARIDPADADRLPASSIGSRLGSLVRHPASVAARMVRPSGR